MWNFVILPCSVARVLYKVENDLQDPLTKMDQRVEAGQSLFLRWKTVS